MTYTRLSVLGLALTAALFGTACGSEAPPERTEPVAAAPEQPAEDTITAVAPAITIRPVSNIDPGRFPHFAHGMVECGTCHANVPGHGRHTGLECTQCHTAPAGERARPSAEECNACHHGPEQTHACADCHSDRPRTPTRVTVAADMSVRPTPTTLSLPFDHEFHGSRACSDCHTVEDGRTVIRQCAACHTSHHDEARRCLTCHTRPALPLHELNAHVGCAGTGCHQDAAVANLDLARPVCLVCHARQENHEPGMECALCHLFDRPESGAVALPGGRGR